MSEGDEEDTPESESNPETLRVALEESRRTFDNQLALTDEIDDKAMRTVRTAVIVLGLLVSAAGIAPDGTFSDLQFFPIAMGGLGAGFLVVAVIVGIGTYEVTNVPFGISADHREEVRT